MDPDTTGLAKLAELKRQLEIISGAAIDASPEQLIPLSFRVSLTSLQDGFISSRTLFPPGRSCAPAGQQLLTILDVSSRSSTGVDGRAVFLLTSFTCLGDVGNPSFAEPVSLVVTPNAATPCYATMTHRLIPNPGSPGAFQDLEITVFTWDADGAAAPNVSFEWRCRLLQSLPIL